MGEERSAVWLNDGSGIFAISGQELERAFRPALGDLDGDGDLDIYLAQMEANTVWLNDGSGAFTDTGQRLGAAITSAVALDDLDGDGDLDALAGGWDEAAKGWLNDGTGAFTEHERSLSPATVHIHDLTLGDVDADGDVDAFMAIASGDPNQVWFNDSAGAFTDSGQRLRSSLAHGVSLGDLDGDGDLDALTAHGDRWSGSSGGQIWLNDGTGLFDQSSLTLGNLYSTKAGLGDLDGDGDLDAFIAHGETWQENGGGLPNEVWLNETITSPSPLSTTPVPPTNTPAPEAVSLQAPQGSAATIDGTFSPGEWDDALRTNLTYGGELMLMHDDDYLYLGIRSREMGFGSICTADDNRVSILHSSAGLGTAIFENDGDDWRRVQQFSYCCWEAGQSRLDEFLREEGWVASVGPRGVPEEMEYRIAMNGGSITLALVYVDDFSFETALYWPEDLADDCLGLALTPEDPPERLSFSSETWVTITAAIDTTTPPPTQAVSEELIAFTSARDGDYDIYIMNVDGSDLRQLTNDPGTEGYAVISPDGTKIAFYAYDDLTTWSIYVMDVDGRIRQRLTKREGVRDNAPVWSPDGTQLVFGREHGDQGEIWVMNADGSNQKKLEGIFGGGPRWSPDGTQIVFSSASTGDSEIAVINADGSNQRQLTDNAAEDWWPSWSPDGTQIAFMSGRAGEFEIYVMNANGSEQQQLTNNKAENYRPIWSPDGDKIIFTSKQDGDFEIYVMNADGSNQRQLTNNSVPDIQPTWWRLTLALTDQ